MKWFWRFTNDDEAGGIREEHHKGGVCGGDGFRR